jgi:hypothetical protein
MTLNALRHCNNINNVSKFFEYTEMYPEKPGDMAIKDAAADLLVFVHSRTKAISHNRRFEHLMNSFINEYKKNDIIIIYPEQ